MNYTLKRDGDSVEQKACDIFLYEYFSSYEKFWQNFVTPLTLRPVNIGFKTDIQLKQNFPRETTEVMHERICIAQLHYSTLIFLISAWEGQKASEKNFVDGVIKCFSSIYSSLDISAELIGRYKRLKSNEVLSTDNFDPKSLEDAKTIRRNFQKLNPYPEEIKAIRDYRDNLIHGRMMFRYQTPFGAFMALPNIGKEREYLDWRKAIQVFENHESHDFMYSGEITKQAFNKTVNYLEKMWRQELLV